MRGRMWGLFRTMPLRYFTLTAVVSWTTAVGLLYFFVWSNEQIQIVEQARHVARAVLYRDTRTTMLLPRLAVSNADSLLRHDGFFTTATIESTFIGKHKPTLLISQVESAIDSDAAKGFEIRAAIVSNDPARLTHVPDQWEANALEALNKGESEFSEVVRIGNEPHLRFAGALLDAPVCQRCHARKDYRPGTLRGAMIVVIPITGIWEAASGHRMTTMLILGVVWVIGLGGIGLMRRGMRQRIDERDQAMEERRRVLFEKSKTELALARSGEQLIQAEKRLHAEMLRTEIAANLHDDIGATLSSTSIFSELLDKELRNASPESLRLLSRIKHNLHTVQLSLHDIVWSINPENDTLENILVKLQDESAEILEAGGVMFRCSIPVFGESITVPMDVRKELLLFIKEAMNNIVKHANAREVIFEVSIVERVLRLSIRDDGCGFPMEQKSDGNGLRNIKQRAVRIGGALLLDSRPGDGTSLVLEFSLAS